MKWLALCLIFTGCSSYMMTEGVEVYPSDIPKIRAVLAETESDEVAIRNMQDAIRWQTPDLVGGMLFSAYAGIGLGFYESRAFYGSRAFPGESGWFYDWYRQDHSGDAWLKIGDSDKLARSLWTYSMPKAKRFWLRYFGGFWPAAAVAHFLIESTTATIIRSYAKHGELRFNFEISLPVR